MLWRSPTISYRWETRIRACKPMVAGPTEGTTDRTAVKSPRDEDLLDRLELSAFCYFLETVNSANGLVADRTRQGSPSSIAVVGFALTCYPVAVERGWMARADAA